MNEKRFLKLAHHKISLQQLWHAVVAADVGSLRQASEICLVKQSTLSRSVRQLEHLVKIPVFERSSRGIQPTSYGKVFLATAKSILDQIESVALATEGNGRGQVGRISIGFYTSLSTGNLRATLVEFAKRHPQIDICMVEGSRTALAMALRNGTIDIAIVTGDHPFPGLKAMPLWSERLLVALPKAHRLAANEVISWTDLSGETLLLNRIDPGPVMRDYLGAKLISSEERPNIIWHDVSRENVKSLVGADFGIGLALEASLGANFEGVVHREIRDGMGYARIAMSASWRENNQNPSVVRFLDLLKQRYPLPG